MSTAERSRGTQGRRRAGIALLAALALMALIALLIVGAVSTMSVAQRSARSGHTDALLTAAADYGLNSLMSDPATYALADLPYGVARSFVLSAPGAAPVHTSVTATRLRQNVLWLVAQATLGGPDSGQRRLNLVARFPFAGPLPPAAVLSRGAVSIGAGVAFPPDTSSEPDCAAAVLADVVVAPGASVTGNARVLDLASAGDSTSYLIAARQVAALDGMPGVVHVRGDTTIAAGTFAGILIVDGSLTIAGPFAASGLLVAGGRIRAVAGGFSLTGALASFSAPTDGTPSVDLADATIRYSGCTLAHRFRTASAPRPVTGRSWAELF